MQPVPHRPLSEAEAGVLRAAVSSSAVAHFPVDLEEAIKDAVVRTVCGCGCASLGFTEASEPDPVGTRLVADAMAFRPGSKSEWVGILVYAAPQGLVEMEIHTPFDGPALLPDPDAVQAWPVDL